MKDLDCLSRALMSTQGSRMAIKSAFVIISRNLLKSKSLYVLWGSKRESRWFKSNLPLRLISLLISLCINSNLKILIQIYITLLLPQILLFSSKPFVGDCWNNIQTLN